MPWRIPEQSGRVNLSECPMYVGSGVKGDEGGAGLGHAGLLPWNLVCRKVTAATAGIQAKWVSRCFSRGFKRSGCPGVSPGLR